MANVVPVLDKFKGTLIGCAVGDALGAPVEGLPPALIREKHGRVTDFIDARFGAGRITDDTQMTVSLAQSIIETGRFDLQHTGHKFASWMAASDQGTKEARGVGMACGVACRRLNDGVSPEESGVGSAGCGAAMRASPVGLRFYHDLETLRFASIEQARITHTDPEALAGSAAVAFSVSLGIKDEGNLEGVSLAERTSDFVSQIDHGMAAKIAGLSDYLDASPEEGFSYTGTGGHVMETVPAALFAFLRSPYDFEETVLTAVNAGGDTDSVGAIAGAVSGSFNGIERIPDRWKENVEGGGYLEVLALRLYSLTPAGKPKPKKILL
jgi:ADP-ribosylglycohydrolase